MVWWWPWGSGQAPQGEPARGPDALERRCKSRRSALTGCRLANPDRQAEACKNLELAVVTCLSEGLCKPLHDEHRRCYTSVYKTGQYKGQGHCIPYEEAMKECLRKQKLYPV
ncbi:Ubiquitin C-terminal hydrolase 22 [Pleodorina starrii]|uniref:Ubiquitin C-terminal hydrolase 22 n=1 Tax=Pleodorina starrii TaxID=330485 RepID=A0A9W6F877_9CHLO|nr:hypothetical protein PLESTM_001472100 [Pleodorina starrii]GLC59939.1 Ubiquitin C-terminal hydrolase 22 [Pleodorina starrii]GLC72833.1 hypothetical protein PLESTF_001298000 [Pleodorina starrii]